MTIASSRVSVPRVLGAILLLILVAVGVWITTYFTGVAVDTGIVQGPSVPDPTK